MSRSHEQQERAGGGEETLGRSPVVVAISDLMLGSRAREALKALGLDAVVASSQEDLARRLDEGARLFIIDLGEPAWSPVESIRRARANGIPVLAFGRHTDVETLDAAREAGADRVVPRSAFAASLPDLVRELAGAGPGGA